MSNHRRRIERIEQELSRSAPSLEASHRRAAWLAGEVAFKDLPADAQESVRNWWQLAVYGHPDAGGGLKAAGAIGERNRAELLSYDFIPDDVRQLIESLPLDPQIDIPPAESESNGRPQCGFREITQEDGDHEGDAETSGDAPR